MPDLDVCPVEELPPGEMKIVTSGLDSIGVYNIDGAYFALEDRCSHDDGPLCEGDFGSRGAASSSARATGPNFDIRTGGSLSLAGHRARRDVPRPRRGRGGQSLGLISSAIACESSSSEGSTATMA